MQIIQKKNRSLNGEIYKIIQIIESNGDSISSDFRISVDSSGNYSYDVEGTTLSRFKADVYGHSYIDDLTTEEANASAQQMVEDMLKRYEIPYDHSDYKASELKKAQEAGLPEQLTKEETLKIISVRYALSTTSFRKYIPVTIATDASENTVAAIQENKSLLEGVDVQEDPCVSIPTVFILHRFLDIPERFLRTNLQICGQRIRMQVTVLLLL